VPEERETGVIARGVEAATVRVAYESPATAAPQAGQNRWSCATWLPHDEQVSMAPVYAAVRSMGAARVMTTVCS